MVFGDIYGKNTDVSFVENRFMRHEMLSNGDRQRNFAQLCGC